MSKTKINYPAYYRCPQAALYSVCRKGWQNALSQKAKLAAFRGIYTEEFIEAALKAIDDAERLPDLDARVAEPRKLRVQLIPLANTCTDKFMLLQGYIDGAFPANERKIMYNAAGHANFAKASAESWNAVNSLNSSMNNFIEKYATQLAGTDDTNMPADFATQVTAATVAFAAKLAEFTFAEETHLATVAKLKANNLIYKQLMAMFVDARRVFRRDRDTARLFVFDRVLFSVAPTLARFSPKFIDDVTNEPLKNVMFVMRSPDMPQLSEKSNIKGICNFGTVESGDDYTGSILPPDGYEPVTDIPLVIPKGEHVRKVYRLKRAA